MENTGIHRIQGIKEYRYKEIQGYRGYRLTWIQVNMDTGIQ